MMKSIASRFLLCLLFMLPAFSINSQSAVPEANWDRALALEVIRRTDTDSVLSPLYRLARTGGDTELIDALTLIERDPSLPGPAKDYLLFTFTVGLSDLEAEAVSGTVLDFLSTYETKTLVRHDEHPHLAVPMYNVRAAAAGLRNQWDRQLASSRSTRLLQGPAEQWISSYLSATTAGRRGFVDALDFASPGQLHELALSSLARLTDNPELTRVAARASLNSGDIEMLEQSISLGSGPAISTALAESSRMLDAAQSIRLLKSCLMLDSDTKAALAIAHLAPLHMDEHEVQRLMFRTLSNRNRGAAAALVLGQSKIPEIQDELRDIALKDQGLAGQRAEMAIESGRAGKEAEL